MEYTYDNSAANPRNPNHPPRRVVYGPSSTDEMAGLHIAVAPVDPDDSDDLGGAAGPDLKRAAALDHGAGRGPAVGNNFRPKIGQHGSSRRTTGLHILYPAVINCYFVSHAAIQGVDRTPTDGGKNLGGAGRNQLRTTAEYLRICRSSAGEQVQRSAAL